MNIILKYTNVLIYPTNNDPSNPDINNYYFVFMIS